MVGWLSTELRDKLWLIIDDLRLGVFCWNG
jgi:hypothetical protein